ncbi:hypothetical protein [Kineococcus aurantiacus]|uniref:hypothetical protein n=1 Tax=Kineococcus aurantiacus TaxID=37633 RepID=UPI0031D39A2F
MSAIALQDLPPARQADVLAALAAVETADEPVKASGFRALLDPSLTSTLRRCLAEAGRVLLHVEGGWLSGYDDQVATRLVQEGAGVLREDDRAVLTLVLLHAVAIPRSRGRSGTAWSDAEPVAKEELYRSQVSRKAVDASVSRLRDAGILAYGAKHRIIPGPQFDRLTEQASASLWEELVLVAQPHGVMAHVIRRRRAARDITAGPAPAPALDRSSVSASVPASVPAELPVASTPTSTSDLGTSDLGTSDAATSVAAALSKETR